VSALALTFVQRGAWWLFDCGEGTQHQVLRSPLKLGRLEKIFITHLHGDHVFGLPGLLASRSLADSADEPLTIYGPTGIKRFVNTALSITGTHLAYPLNIVEIEINGDKGQQEVLKAADIRVECAPLSHGAPSLAFAIVEADKAGRLDIGHLRELGVPQGPVYAELKSGKTVTLPDGRTFDGREFVGPAIRGRKVVICGDTKPTPNVALIAKDADVLVHEATFTDEDADLAKRANHSTARQAAQAAVDAGVRTLILTHFSPRYDAADNQRMPQLLDEAKLVFADTLLAEDLWTYSVTRKADE
jgi:ribonuclease Z